MVSVIPFCTMSIIYHVKHDMKNLEAYLLLSKGYYIGSAKQNKIHKLDNIELQMLTTESNREITEDAQLTTKISDTTLV